MRIAFLLAAFGGLLWAMPARADTAPNDREAQVVRGLEGWLYFAPELRHLETLRFWGEDAARVSRARRPEWADPLPAILDFARQLEERDVTLLLVPVPAKATIHPEGLPPSRAVGLSDAGNRAFYEVLRGQGVEVLDLTDAFRALRRREPRPLYLRQDTHWADPAIREAAQRIAARVRELGPGPGRGETFATRTRELEIRGDLLLMLKADAPAPERTRITEVGRGSSFEPIASDRESPVLLLGDSHNLVFHAGGTLHARGAGLPDHLARELGYPVDVIAVRGSGATPARMDLLRRSDALDGKRVVVWCLSVREFTQSSQGWRVLPVSP